MSLRAVTGVSVSSGFAKLMPRWLVWLGLVVAAVAELSSSSLILPMAGILLPLARFPALVWMIGVGFSMPKSRRGQEGERSGSEGRS